MSSYSHGVRLAGHSTLNHLSPGAHRSPEPPDPSPDEESPLLLARAIDVLSDGFILTDAASRVIHLNRAARTMASGGTLAVRNGLLCARTPGETRALQDMIATRAQGETGEAYLRTSGASSKGCAFLTVTAVHREDCAAEEPTVIVIARQLQRVSAPTPQMIGTFFGLTPAEARLAHEAIKGDGLGRCASRLGISTSTARSHLKHVFDKTGTKRQAELVRLLFSCGSSIAEQRHGSAAATLPARLRVLDRTCRSA